MQFVKKKMVLNVKKNTIFIKHIEHNYVDIMYWLYNFKKKNYVIYGHEIYSVFVYKYYFKGLCSYGCLNKQQQTTQDVFNYE